MFVLILSCTVVSCSLHHIANPLQPRCADLARTPQTHSFISHNFGSSGGTANVLNASKTCTSLTQAIFSPFSVGQFQWLGPPDHGQGLTIAAGLRIFLGLIDYFPLCPEKPSHGTLGAGHRIFAFLFSFIFQFLILSHGNCKAVHGRPGKGGGDTAADTRISVFVCYSLVLFD